MLTERILLPLLQRRIWDPRSPDWFQGKVRAEFRARAPNRDCYEVVCTLGIALCLLVTIPGIDLALARSGLPRPMGGPVSLLLVLVPAAIIWHLMQDIWDAIQLARTGQALYRASTEKVLSGMDAETCLQLARHLRGPTTR